MMLLLMHLVMFISGDKNRSFNGISGILMFNANRKEKLNLQTLQLIYPRLFVCSKHLLTEIVTNRRIVTQISSESSFISNCLQLIGRI